jgi:hypothetical protein
MMKKTIKSNSHLIDRQCVCNPICEKTFSSQTNNANISNYVRIANLLSNNSLKGKIQFGNDYLKNNNNISSSSSNTFFGLKNKF